MRKTTNKLSPEGRERAGRMVLGNETPHGSRWQAGVSISAKIGCAAQTLDEWAKRAKNGPATAGHGAEAVRDAIARAVVTLPWKLRRSLAWDQGAEMARHAELKILTGLPVYFCDPHSPWQRGTNENTNGLLRRYFPKGTDLSAHGPEDLEAVAATLTSRPRETLGWRTPAEALDEVLRKAEADDVATTG